MSKNCIYAFFIPSGNDVMDESYNLGIESIKKYAKKINVDFFIKNWRDVSIGHHIMKERLFAHDLFKKYDRVLCIGLDIIIRENSGNIFEDCPDESLVYMLNERYWWTQWDHAWTHYWKKILEKGRDIVGKVDVKTQDYFNADVCLCSRPNKILFEDQNDWFDGVLGDQDYINYKIVKHDIQIGKLPLVYNTITCHTDYPGAPEGLREGTHEKAYFLHYSDPKEKPRMVEEWKGRI
jgi:lipopolysaccharide biosynthesis glycosyltransferase